MVLMTPRIESRKHATRKTFLGLSLVQTQSVDGARRAQLAVILSNPSTNLSLWIFDPLGI